MIGFAFAVVLALGGAGLARHLDSEDPPASLGAAAILAGFAILVGDGASIVRYSPAAAIAAAALLAAAGWIRPGRLSLRGLIARIPRRSPVILLLAATALALAVPLVILPVPFDTDAQGFGYLSLMIRAGGTISSLAPWHPEIGYLYAPGALVVFATLSALFASVPMSGVMMGAAHAAAFLFVWLALEFGREVGRMVSGAPGMNAGEAERKRERWAGVTAFCAACSAGLWTALMDSHYTAVMALFFLLAALTGIFRHLRTGRRRDAILASLLMAGVIITQPDMAIILALCLAPFVLLAWLASDRPPFRSWLRMSFAVPAAAVILVAPWLAHIWPLIDSGLASPFAGILAGWQVPIFYHGLIWPALALLGAGIYLRGRRMWALMMAGWLLGALEFGSIGLLPRVFPGLTNTLLRFAYPFSIAWHAPIIPYLALGAGALVWIADRINAWRFEKPAVGIIFAAVLPIGLAMLFPNTMLALTKSRPGPYGALATSNDILAMRWLHDHAPPDARVLNYPGDYGNLRDWEAQWAPAVAERDCVYFRMQPFFSNESNAEDFLGNVRAEQQRMLSFWRDPADIANLALLRQAKITYVLVPESIGDPASMARSWRWQPPARLPDAISLPEEAAYLRLVFSAGGARVYAVLF